MSVLSGETRTYTDFGSMRKMADKPNLRELRLRRLKEYVQIFGLSAQNAVGLDSIVHGAEYRREDEIEEEIRKTTRMKKKKKRELN
jgi:hypothetical protein